MGKLLDKTLGKAVNAVFNGAVKGTVATVKGVGKGVLKVSEINEKVVTGFGNGVIGVGKGVGTIGKKASNIAKGTGNIIENATDGRVHAHLTKELTDEALENATLYERMVGKKLTAGGVAAVTGATMAISTVGAVADNGGSKFSKLGYTSVGENLDRLVSYDGSGFVNRFNEVSNGDPEVMQDIAKNTFNNINQFGASGDIVFALHNMREG